MECGLKRYYRFFILKKIEGRQEMFFIYVICIRFFANNYYCEISIIIKPVFRNFYFIIIIFYILFIILFQTKLMRNIDNYKPVFKGGSRHNAHYYDEIFYLTL